MVPSFVFSFLSVNRYLSKAPTTNAIIRTVTAVTMFNAGIKVKSSLACRNENTFLVNDDKGACKASTSIPQWMINTQQQRFSFPLKVSLCQDW